MTCREFAGFMDAYMSKELPEPTLVGFERHLAVCVNCQRYLSQYRASILMGRAAFHDPGAELPADVPEDLVAAILAARTAR